MTPKQANNLVFWGVIAGCLIITAFFSVSSVKEQAKEQMTWEAFKVEHKCKAVRHEMIGWWAIATSTPNKEVWSCDGGVPYMRNMMRNGAQ